MKATTETAPPAPRRTFFADRPHATGAGAAPEPGAMLVAGRVDARTAELRERIAAASRLPLIGALLSRR